ncbi:DUF6783 domain-containing protein [uncultured Robinsoniella sp.]|uniref:DUF6783 domain-containing protein n=1 Tax=uncultured Robinsoniella sp. TaxID=904190 RepID=UPI00374E658F
MKIHSCHLYAPLCGIFAPNSGYVARYAPFIRDKSPSNCDAQLPESNFKTRSSTALCNDVLDILSGWNGQRNRRQPKIKCPVPAPVVCRCALGAGSG